MGGDLRGSAGANKFPAANLHHQTFVKSPDDISSTQSKLELIEFATAYLASRLQWIELSILSILLHVIVVSTPFFEAPA